MDTAQTITPQPDLMEAIFQRIYTKSDLLLFYSQLDQTRGLLFKTSANLDEQLGSFFNTEMKEKILKLISTQQVDSKNPIKVQELFTKIEDYGKTLPVVSMTFAIPPTEVLLKNINNWFLDHEKRKVLIDVSFERNLIGGAFISYDGLYSDATLINKVNEYFENNSA